MREGIISRGIIITRGTGKHTLQISHAQISWEVVLLQLKYKVKITTHFLSQVTIIPFEIIPYLTEEVTYTTARYYTSVVKCIGGVACTHVCTQINSIIILLYIPRHVIVM